MALSKGLKDRGVFLSFLMGLSAFINFWAIILYSVEMLKVTEHIYMPTLANEISQAGVAGFIALSVGNLISLWGVYKWKWWGVAGYTLMHLGAVILSRMTGGSGTINLIWPVLLIILILPIRKDFRWGASP